MTWWDEGMRYWLLVLNEDDFTEQLAYEVGSVDPEESPPAEAADGDEVALAGPGGVFALGELSGATVVYRRRLEKLHDAVHAAEVGWKALEPESWEALARALPPPERRSDWLVSLTIPVEAADRAEAVRLFWSYIRSLGPAELPAFVSPYGSELEGVSFLLSGEHEQDPEED